MLLQTGFNDVGSKDQLQQALALLLLGHALAGVESSQVDQLSSKLISGVNTLCFTAMHTALPIA